MLTYINTIGLLLISGAFIFVAGVDKNIIEVRVFVDYPAYTNGYIKAVSKNGDMRTFFNDYVNSMFSSANAIFKTLEKDGIHIEARIAEIVLIEKSSAFTKAFNPKTENVDDYMNKFDEFSSKGYSAVDHSMLLTGLDLMLDSGDPPSLLDGRFRGSGSSRLNSMCKQDSISIIELGDMVSPSFLMVRQLGTSLGLRSDGRDDNCSPDSGKLTANLRVWNSAETYKFSSCYISTMKTYLNNLKKRAGGSCLLTRQTQAPAVTSVGMGNLYSPDDICRIFQGPYSRFFREEYKYTNGGYYFDDKDRGLASVCNFILCQREEGMGVGFLGTDGFVCGSGKRCDLGHCRDSSDAPTSPTLDKCPFGDGAYSCKKEMCPYRSQTNSVCCKTCHDIPFLG